MATFRIHEDVENSIPNKTNLIPTKLNEKRCTFAVLNNVQRGPKAHALKTVIFISNFLFFIFKHNLKRCNRKFVVNFCISIVLQGDDLPGTKNKTFNDENAAPKDAFVPDKFKAFNVAGGANKNVSNFGDESEKMDTIQNISSFR